MPLRSKLFGKDRLLEACLLQDSAHVLLGAKGDHVAKLQVALGLLDGAEIAAADRTGKSYGQSTASAVLSYKAKRNIINRSYQTKPDAVVGKMTMAALDTEMLARENQAGEDDGVCCNGDPASLGHRHHVAHQFYRYAETLPGGVGALRTSAAPAMVGAAPVAFASFDLFSNFKAMSATQIALAKTVFGTSVDYRFVFLSDIKGLQGRAFTVAFGPFVVLNCGTFTPTDRTLIHELTHAWQSQHHTDSTAFMGNSLKSQALATAENKVLGSLDPALTSDPLFPMTYPRSPYACMTGKPFGDYAAEQIAKQVERNFLATPGDPIAVATDPIVAHIKAVASGRSDPDNVTGLNTARTEDKRAAGALF